MLWLGTKFTGNTGLSWLSYKLDQILNYRTCKKNSRYHSG